MVKIRLARSGAKNKPFYHIVVTDKANPRDGRYIERLGFLNPVAVGGETPLKLDIERIEYWQSQGAQMSERVVSLVKFFHKHGAGQSASHPAPSISETKSGQPAPAPQDVTAG
jgi:small subunit ribosomal protein S16